MELEWKAYRNGKFIHACGIESNLIEVFGTKADFVELTLGDRTLRIYREELGDRLLERFNGCVV